MPNIASVATVSPSCVCNIEETRRAGTEWLKEHPDEQALFLRFVKSSQASKRAFIVPVDALLSLGGTAARAKLFHDYGPPLIREAAFTALEKARIKATDIDSLIFTSCSCPTIPSIDALLIEDLGLKNNVNRLPIYQHGCAGGVIGLSLARRLSSNRGCTLVCSLELCSLVFQKNDFAASNLVGSAIFADGAASAVISDADKGLVFVDSQSFLVPGTRHLMGYDLMDDGSYLKLDKDLPGQLARAVPDIVAEFLLRRNLVASDISWWLFHPGGTKILNYLEESFCLGSAQCRWAREVLATNGNMSSATIFFVLDRFNNSQAYEKGDYVLMVGIGPGITVELVLFQYR